MPRAPLKTFFRFKALQCKIFTGYFGSTVSLAIFAPKSEGREFYFGGAFMGWDQRACHLPPLNSSFALPCRVSRKKSHFYPLAKDLVDLTRYLRTVPFQLYGFL